jgi:hypothetical protein
MHRLCAVLAVLSLSSAPAWALDLGVRVELGPAFPVDTPQSHLFDTGGALSLKVGIAPLKFLDLSLAGQFVGMPATSSNHDSSTGEAWSLGVNVRVYWPHANTLVSPWVDFEPAYVRTGNLDRFGYSIGAGCSIPAGATHRYWFGPFFRYQQIVDPSNAARDTTDSKAIIAGVALDVGVLPLHRAPVEGGGR